MGATIETPSEIEIQQQYEIEALTDVINEMLTTKNVDVDFDINKRVEHKKFLKKLGENPNDLNKMSTAHNQLDMLNVYYE